MATFTISFSTIGQTLVSHNFNNGIIAPFEVCNVKAPNYTKVVNNRVETYWSSTGYDGTRNDRGVEFCGHVLGEWISYKEGWLGTTIQLGSDYPENKTAAIGQIMGRRIVEEFSTWQAHLLIENGDLRVSYRAGAGTNNIQEATVYENFPKSQNIDVVWHFVLSLENKGEMEIWINGVSEFKVTGISLGFGEFQNDEQVPGASRTIFKLGQYNFDSSNYDIDETRTVYYDNVTWYSKADGYDIVSPNNLPQTECMPIIAEQQINAERFCSNNGGSVNTENEGGSYVGGIKNTYFYNYGEFDFDSNDINSIETAVGKSSTKDTYIEVRLDSPTGVLIGTVDASESTGGSQNWVSISAKLQATTGIHDVYLVFTGQENVTLVNFNWFRFFKEDNLSVTTNKLVGPLISPNPIEDNFQINGYSGAKFSIYNATGKKLLGGQISDDLFKVNMDNYPSGFYFLKVVDNEGEYTSKLIKK